MLDVWKILGWICDSLLQRHFSSSMLLSSVWPWWCPPSPGRGLSCQPAIGPGVCLLRCSKFLPWNEWKFMHFKREIRVKESIHFSHFSCYAFARCNTNPAAIKPPNGHSSWTFLVLCITIVCWWEMRWEYSEYNMRWCTIDSGGSRLRGTNN